MYLQFVAVDSRNFLVLTFASYVFLVFGTVFLFYAANTEKLRKGKIFINIIAFIFIAAILLGAVSLGAVPRGGVFNEYDAQIKDFTLTLEKGSWSEGNRIVYGYSAYQSETIFKADYPVGFVDVFPQWFSNIRIAFEKSINSSGSIYTSLQFFSPPESWLGLTQGTIRQPIAILNGESDVIRIDNGLHWGSYAPDSRRLRVEGYKITFDVALYLEEEVDYGQTVQGTVKSISDRNFLIRDYVVDSKLQSMISILLCGTFIAAVGYIPAKSISPKLNEKLAPTLNNLEKYQGQV